MKHPIAVVSDVHGEARWVCIANEEGQIKVWPLVISAADADARPPRAMLLRYHRHRINCLLGFIRNGQPCLLSGSDDTTAKIFGMKSEYFNCLSTEQHHDVIMSLEKHTAVVKYYLVTGSAKEGCLHICSMHCGTCVRTIRMREHGIRCIASTNHIEGGRMVTGGSDGEVRVYDPDDGHLLLRLGKDTSHHTLYHGSAVVGLCVTRDCTSPLIVSASIDNIICVTNFDGDCVASFNAAHGDELGCVSLWCGKEHEEQQQEGGIPTVHAFTGSSDGVLKVWWAEAAPPAPPAPPAPALAAAPEAETDSKSKSSSDSSSKSKSSSNSSSSNSSSSNSSSSSRNISSGTEAAAATAVAAAEAAAETPSAESMEGLRLNEGLRLRFRLVHSNTAFFDEVEAVLACRHGDMHPCLVAGSHDGYVKVFDADSEEDVKGQRPVLTLSECELVGEEAVKNEHQGVERAMERAKARRAAEEKRKQLHAKLEQDRLDAERRERELGERRRMAEEETRQRRVEEALKARQEAVCAMLEKSEDLILGLQVKLRKIGLWKWDADHRQKNVFTKRAGGLVIEAPKGTKKLREYLGDGWKKGFEHGKKPRRRHHHGSKNGDEDGEEELSEDSEDYYSSSSSESDEDDDDNDGFDDDDLSSDSPPDAALSPTKSERGAGDDDEGVEDEEAAEARRQAQALALERMEREIKRLKLRSGLAEMKRDGDLRYLEVILHRREKFLTELVGQVEALEQNTAAQLRAQELFLARRRAERMAAYKRRQEERRRNARERAERARRVKEAKRQAEEEAQLRKQREERAIALAAEHARHHTHLDRRGSNEMHSDLLKVQGSRHRKKSFKKKLSRSSSKSSKGSGSDAGSRAGSEAQVL